ncbi:hypothetical protein D3C86_1699070 [compost metagenome]
MPSDRHQRIRHEDAAQGAGRGGDQTHSIDGGRDRIPWRIGAGNAALGHVSRTSEGVQTALYVA